MIEIKPAVNKSDFKIISELAAEIWTAHYTPIIGKGQVDYMLDKFQSTIAIENQTKEGYQYYFVFADEFSVGYMSFIQKEKSLFLSKIYVLNSERGKGIGKFMIDFIQQKAIHLTLKSVSLTVNKQNTDAIKAYKKMDFKIIGNQVADIGNGFVMDDFLMEKILD